jgi:Fe-S cluster assembly protein SufD
MNVEIKPLKTAAEQGIAANFAAAKSHLPGGQDIARLREGAFQTFVESGLPHRRIEEWKYTDLRALMREAAPLAAGGKLSADEARKSDPLGDVTLRKLVFVNGRFAPELSDLEKLESKLTIVPLARALADKHPLTARIGVLKPETRDPALELNTAFLNDGVLIELGEGAALDRPIHLRHVFTGKDAAAAFARAVFIVGKGANGTLIESFEGPDGVAYQVNSALEVHVAD